MVYQLKAIGREEWPLLRAIFLNNDDDGVFIYNPVPKASKNRNLIVKPTDITHISSRESNHLHTILDPGPSMAQMENSQVGILIIKDASITKNRRNGINLMNFKWILHPWLIKGNFKENSLV